MKISQQQAREFLEKINNKDNVMIFTHKDLDGFAAGSLLYNFCKEKGAKVKVAIIDYGVTKISDSNTSGFNKILLSDLAPGMVWEDLSRLKDKEILYTDHHQAEEKSPIPEFVLELRTTDEGYIPSSRTCYELTEPENQELQWLGVAGTLSDMGQLHEINKDFLENYYSESVSSFDKMNKISFILNDVIIFFSASIESFYKIAELKNILDVEKLKKFYEPVETEFERLTKQFKKERKDFGNIIYFYLESKFKMLKSSLTTGLSGDEPNKIYVFCTPKQDNIISISGRNQSREYDLVKLIRSCLDGLKDGFAGGHKSAVGGQVDKSDLEKFKERLKQINLEEYRI
jgi:single-stranded DNA-specific DHH superfamily exonuclease